MQSNMFRKQIYIFYIEGKKREFFIYKNVLKV